MNYWFTNIYNEAVMVSLETDKIQSPQLAVEVLS